MTAHGNPHVLIVTEVGDGEALDEFDECEVLHTPSCAVRTESIDDDLRPASWQWYECAVGYVVDNIGIRWTLDYSGTPVNEPGRYLITAWHETIRGFDYTEYDGGLAVIFGFPASWVHPLAVSSATLPTH